MTHLLPECKRSKALIYIVPTIYPESVFANRSKIQILRGYLGTHVFNYSPPRILPKRSLLENPNPRCSGSAPADPGPHSAFFMELIPTHPRALSPPLDQSSTPLLFSQTRKVKDPYKAIRAGAMLLDLF